MIADARERLLDIGQNIDSIRHLLSGKTVDDVRSQRDTRAALERFLEIISEASRHVPEEWRRSFGAHVAWRDLANLGDILCHAHDTVDVNVLWSVYQNDLDPLEEAVDAMPAEHPPKEGLP